MPPTVQRSQKTSSSSQLAAQRAAAERAAAERRRKEAEAARKAAEERKRQAQEAKAKLAEAVKKPDADPKEVKKLRDTAAQEQQKADVAEKVALKKEEESKQADQKAGVVRTEQVRQPTGDSFTAVQSQTLEPCYVPADEAATNEAKFVNAAAQNGNGAEALASSLKNYKADPAYTDKLIAETKDAVLAGVREKAKTDPAAAAKEYREIIEKLPDPASRKAFIDASKDDIAAIVAAPKTAIKAPTQELLKELARAGNAAGPDGLKSMTDAVAQGWPADTRGITPGQEIPVAVNPLQSALRDNQYSSPAETGPFAQSLAKSLDEAGKTDAAAVVRDSDTSMNPLFMLDAPTRVYNDAKSNVEANNQRLQQQLSRIGPNLTPAQREQYIKDFNNQPQVKQDIEALQRASKDLGAAIERVANRAGNSDVAQGLLRKAAALSQELAKSPTTAVEAKNAAVALMKRDNLPADLKEQLEETIKSAVPNIYADMLQLSGGDPKAAAERFASQMEFLEQNRNIFSNLQPLAKAAEILRSCGSVEDVQKAFASLEDISKDAKFSKTFKGLGVLFSVALLAGGPSPDAEKFIEKTANAGKEGLELIAEAMKTYADAFKSSRYAAGATKTASLIEKFTPGLAVLANTLAAHQDLIKYQSRNGNWGDLVSLIGNSTAALGSVLELTGIGAGPGKVLQTLGSIASGIGGIASSLVTESSSREEMKTLLSQQPGLGDISEQLIDRNVAALSEKTKLSGEDVQRLLRSHPEIFKNSVSLTRFTDIAEASRLTGADVAALAEATRANPRLLMDTHHPSKSQMRYNLWANYPEVRELMRSRGIVPPANGAVWV